MTFSVSTVILLNAAYYLGFSILGFMSLFREFKKDGFFDLGYIVIAVSSCMCAVFMLSQLGSIVDWYYTKILVPQVRNELGVFCSNANASQLELLEQSLINNNSQDVFRDRVPLNHSSLA